MAKQTRKAANGNPVMPEMMTAMMPFNPAGANALSEIMSEGMRFMTESWQHSLDTQKAVMACRSPMDLMQVQMEFMQKTAGHYSEYATRVYSIMSTAGEDVMRSTKSPFARKYDDVPV